MKNYKILFKMLYTNSKNIRMKDTSKKKETQKIILLSCLLVPLAGLLCAFLGFLSYYMPDINSLSNFLVTITISIQAMVMFTSIPQAMRTLYSSENAKYLLSLPLRSNEVFLANLSIVALAFLKKSMILTIPLLLTCSIVFAVSTKTFFWAFFVLFPLIGLLSPILFLFILTLFSLPIKYLSSYFQTKQWIKTVFSMLMYVVAMLAYFAVIFSFSAIGTTDSTGLSPGFQEALSTISYVFYPIKSLIELTLGINAGINSAITIGSFLLMIILTIVFSMLFYKRISIKTQDVRTSQNHHTFKIKRKSQLKSLILKDTKCLLSNSSMTVLCLGNILMCPLLLIFINLMGIFVNHADAPILDLYPLSMNLLYCLIFLGGANQLSAFAITREGRSFLISKSLPIDAKQALLSKYIISIVPSALTLIVILLILIFFVEFSLIHSFLSILLLFLCILGANALNIYIDELKGNVHWLTPQDMKKSNSLGLMTLLSVLLSVIPTFPLIIGANVIGYVPNGLSLLVNNVILWVPAFLLATALAIAGPIILFTKGVKKYPTIGDVIPKVKEIKPKLSSNKSGGNFIK